MLAVLTARGAIATCKQAFRLVQLVGNGFRGDAAAQTWQSAYMWLLLPSRICREIFPASILTST